METEHRQAKRQAGARPYHIDFVLVVLTGNLTRYLLTRPIVERDPTVEARWYPIRTWVLDDPLQVLPGALRVRLRHLLDSWRLYVRPPADAVVIHAFETYYLYALLKKLLRRDTIVVKNPDGGIPGQPGGLGGRLRALAVAQTNLFVPWSHFAANLIKKEFPNVRDEQVIVLHPGIDLERWPLRPPKEPGERFQLLFVAGNLLLKGADTLVDAFEQYLSDTCDLHIATQSGYLPEDFKRRITSLPHVHLYLDLTPASDELRRLYREADAFVSPTNSDTSSWVALEALATGIPTIICPQGGIPDIVRDGETGLLIPPKDPAAIAEAVNCVRMSDELRRQLTTQGRAHVETNFDVIKNTSHLLKAIKQHVDAGRDQCRNIAPRY